jgi:hypothetical protein
VYTARNPLRVPITVSSLGIARVTLSTQPRDPALPPFQAAELDLSRSGFSGSLVVPALGANNVAAAITLVDNGANQDNCQRASFEFVYAGVATYTETTTTTLTSWPNPGRTGQVVTLTATVTPTDAPPGRPTGHVSFELCSSVSCPSPHLLGTAGVGADGRAVWSTTALPVGTDLVEAMYTSPATEFIGSTSALVSQVVQPARFVAATVPALRRGPVGAGTR